MVLRLDASSPHSPQSARVPLVSVIIPAFNASRHIAANLASVFAQTFSDFEVILVNDGSSDTELMEQAIQPYLSRIIYLKQENRGPSAARNVGIRHARGEWIAFLDSDDVWLPVYLEEQLRFLSNDPALDMAYCDAILADDSGRADKTYMQMCPSTGSVTFESLLFERTQVITSGTVVRRQALINAGLFDEEIRWSEDHDLWLRVVHSGGQIGYQRPALLRRKVRPDSQGADPQNLLAGEIHTLRKLARNLDLNPGTRALLGQRLRETEAALAYKQGKAFLLTGEPHKAYELLGHANALVPNRRVRAMLGALRIAPRLSILAARLWAWQRSTPGSGTQKH